MTLVLLRGEDVTPRVERLLQPAHGSTERARAAAREYRARRWMLYGWVEDRQVVGCIGFEPRPDATVIRSIVVAEPQRMRGVGRKMVEAALDEVDAPWVEAETDAQAVGFYQSLGFTTTTLGQKYPGVERFRCVRASFRRGLEPAAATAQP